MLVLNIAFTSFKELSSVAFQTSSLAVESCSLDSASAVTNLSFLLYGMIGASGIRVLVDAQVDYGKSRNQAMTAIVFVTGLSGISVQIGSIQLTGMVLACVVGMIMGLTFSILDKLNLTNDRD